MTQNIEVRIKDVDRRIKLIKTRLEEDKREFRTARRDRTQLIKERDGQQ